MKEIKVLKKGKENLFLNHFSNNDFYSNLFSFKLSETLSFEINQRNWLEWLTILKSIRIQTFLFSEWSKT